MPKNVVLIPWIEREEAVNSSGIGRADRTKGYKYGVDSWKQWCEKHDVEFFLMDTLLVPESEMVITWQRWYVLEILEKNGICLLYTSPSPRDRTRSRMPSSA